MNRKDLFSISVLSVSSSHHSNVQSLLSPIRNILHYKTGSVTKFTERVFYLCFNYFLSKEICAMCDSHTSYMLTYWLIYSQSIYSCMLNAQQHFCYLKMFLLNLWLSHFKMAIIPESFVVHKINSLGWLHAFSLLENNASGWKNTLQLE